TGARCAAPPRNVGPLSRSPWLERRVRPTGATPSRPPAPVPAGAPTRRVPPILIVQDPQRLPPGDRRHPARISDRARALGNVRGAVRPLPPASGNSVRHPHDRGCVLRSETAPRPCAIAAEPLPVDGARPESTPTCRQPADHPEPVDRRGSPRYGTPP